MTVATPGTTDFITVTGVRVAMRAVGTGDPLVLFHRFRGTLDDWDPALLTALARDRRVITFDSVGVGETTGEVPRTVEAMADFAGEFIRALELDQADILGYSIGGFVAQVLAIKQPRRIRRLILAATTAPTGAPEVVWSDAWLQEASTPVPSPQRVLSLFYTNSPASQAAGRASFGRMRRPPASYVSPAAMAAQAEALTRYARNEGGWYARLKEIERPTFVANGDQDGLFPAIGSTVLAREIPYSRLGIYPDSGHGFLFQYIDRFSEDSLRFLTEDLE